MKKKENWALGLSSIAILLSGYTVFVYDKRIEADWMGILIGILALLVTVLVGWNIYSLIDIRNMCPENIEMNEKNKQYLFDLLSDVNEPRKIQHFPELLSFLSKIKTRQ